MCCLPAFATVRSDKLKGRGVLVGRKRAALEKKSYLSEKNRRGERERRRKVRPRWSKRGPIAILLVSMLLVALTAGAALAANISGTAGVDLIGAGPYKGTSLSG